jgi:hypothetical protein
MRLILIASLGLAACSGSSSNGADAEAMVDCSTVTGADTFTVGLEKKGAAGAVDFKMMSATPAPPARNTNTWIIQINSMSQGVVGSPIDGASIVATPFMPAHQHGSPQQVVVTPAGMPGQYQLTPVFLWMPGVWETTIQVTSGTPDSAVYRFCIPS